MRVPVRSPNVKNASHMKHHGSVDVNMYVILTPSTAMVKFVVSLCIQKVLAEYNAVKNLSEGESGYVNPKSMFVDHLLLVDVASTLQALAEDSLKSQYSLNHLLKTTSLYIELAERREPVVLSYTELILES
jgi:hypothetical protein